jgi:hypothetical protein
MLPLRVMSGMMRSRRALMQTAAAHQTPTAATHTRRGAVMGLACIGWHRDKSPVEKVVD